MNEIDQNWRVWAERSALSCQDQSPPSPNKPTCMDENTSGLCCRPKNSTSPLVEREDEEGPNSFDHDHLGYCTCGRDPRIEEPHDWPIAKRKLDSMLSEQSEIGEGAETDVCLKPQMRVTDFVALVNSSGFGQVVTERNVLRHRRAFREVDAGRGRINVIAYIAAMSSRRSRKRKTEDVSVQDLETLLERQDFRCALTGESLTPENVALDHIVPISEGGSFSVANSQLVTRIANRAKHTISQDEFVILCKRVTQTHAGE